MIRAIVLIAICSLALQDAVAQASKYPWLYPKNSNTSIVKKTPTKHIPNTTSYRRTVKPAKATRKPWLDVVNKPTTSSSVVYSKPTPINRALPWNSPQPKPSRITSTYKSTPSSNSYSNQDISYVEESTPLKAYPWNSPAPSKTYAPPPANTQRASNPPIYAPPPPAPIIRKAAPMPPPSNVRRAVPMPPPSNVRRAVPMPPPSNVRRAAPMPAPSNVRRVAPMPAPTNVRKATPMPPPVYNNSGSPVKIARVAPMPPPLSKKEKRRNKRNRWKNKKSNKRKKALTPIAIITTVPPAEARRTAPSNNYPSPAPVKERYSNPNTFQQSAPIAQTQPAPPLNNDPIFVAPPPPPPSEPTNTSGQYNNNADFGPPPANNNTFNNNNFNPPPPSSAVADNANADNSGGFAPPPPSSVIEDAPSFNIAGGNAKVIEENGERIVVIGEKQETEEFQPLPKELLEERMAYFYDGDWKSLTKKAKSEKKRFFVDFMTDWCRVCKKMEHTTYSDLTVSNSVSQNNFIAYQLNAEKQAKVAAKYNITAFPALLFFDENGKQLGRLDGFVSKTNFLQALENYRPEIPNTEYTEFR